MFKNKNILSIEPLVFVYFVFICTFNNSPNIHSWLHDLHFFTNIKLQKKKLILLILFY